MKLEWRAMTGSGVCRYAARSAHDQPKINRQWLKDYCTHSITLILKTKPGFLVSWQTDCTAGATRDDSSVYA
jgi:hypothetical protein